METAHPSLGDILREIRLVQEEINELKGRRRDSAVKIPRVGVVILTHFVSLLNFLFAISCTVLFLLIAYFLSCTDEELKNNYYGLLVKKFVHQNAEQIFIISFVATASIGLTIMVVYLFILVLRHCHRCTPLLHCCCCNGNPTCETPTNVPPPMSCIRTPTKKLNVGIDKYYLKEEISNGGFSKIYLAKKEDGNKYAVKKIFAHSQLEISRIRREIYAHHAFRNHENSVHLYGVSRERSSNGSFTFYLVMDYYFLGNLQEYIEVQFNWGNPIHQADIISYMTQICSALAFMHQSKPSIAHRDVKPANLLFKSKQHLVLTDFGSAVMVPIDVGSHSESQTLRDEAAELCTMPYRAPELFNCEMGSSYDHRVDTWSTGCVLHSLCFFKAPFDDVIARGDNIALATMFYKFRTPSAHKNHRYSDDLLEILSSMLTVMPNDRPSCADVLQKFLNL